MTISTRSLPNTGKVFARALVSHARRIDRTLPDAMEIRMSRERRERSPEQDASRFIDLVSGSGFWQSVDLRVCAIRSGRRWMNLGTRGFLDHRTPRSVPRFSPVERHQFRAWQVVRPVSDLPAIVRSIAMD